MQNMQNIQGIPVVPAVRVCARACALTMARFLSVCCSPVCCTAPSLAGPRRAAPRRPGWTDAAVAGLQTARGRPCAAAHCPLLDSPAVPGVLPRAVLAGPCALEASFVTVKTQRTQCSKKQKNRAGMYLYRTMTQQNRAGMYLYRKMTGHFWEIALRCICTEKQPVIRHPRVFSRSGTKVNTNTVQTRTDSCVVTP